MSNMSVFGVVSCNCPQRFTSGRRYTGNLVVRDRAKFEGCAAKTVEEVGFLRAMGFSKKHHCQISPHSCQFNGIDLKLAKHVEKRSL